MPERTGTVQRTLPKRGRGPGIIVFDCGGTEISTSTFEPELVRLAASGIGATATFTYEEKPSKDGSKTYTNLLTLAIDMSTRPQEPVETPQDHLDDTESRVLALTNTQHSPKPEVFASGRLEPLSAMVQMEQSFKLAVRQRELLEGFIRTQFKESVHYMDGAIFKSKKRVLLLEGARLIHVCHGHVVRFEVLSAPTAPQRPGIDYLIDIKATVWKNGELVGEGIGSASSLIYSASQGKWIDRATTPGLTRNSTMKMAKKSAYIDSCLNTTALTEFSQDLDAFKEGPDSETRFS